MSVSAVGGAVDVCALCVVQLDTSPDVVVTKLDASGAFVWAIAFGHRPSPSSVPILPAVNVGISQWGNVSVLGYGSAIHVDPGNGLITSAGASDVFLSQFDSSGRLKWQTSFGGPSQDMASGMATDPSGNVFVVGMQADAGSMYVAKFGP